MDRQYVKTGIADIVKMTYKLQKHQRGYCQKETRPRAYKTFIKLNTTEHKISTVIKNKMQKNIDISCF